jgi:hypothetical protein
MLRDALRGATAGAAGTTALNIATYADMTLRGRPSSEVPAEVAGELAQRVGLDLAAGGGDGDGAKQKAQHRRSGLGALMGYGVGLGLGLAYGALRPRLTLPGRLVAGGALGLAAMAASDAPATALKKTNPATWGAAGWLADVVPHLAYGLVTAATYEALAHGA